MKKYLLFVIFFVIFCGFTGNGGAAYVSLHGDYGLNPSQMDIGYIEKSVDGAITEFKVFIPPGAVFVSLKIMCVNDAYWLNSVSHYGSYPVNYGSVPSFVPDGGSTLAQLTTENRFGVNVDGVMWIIRQRFTTPISESSAGWLYVKVLGGSNIYRTHLQIEVKTAQYNTWYQTIDNWYEDVDVSGTYTGSTTTGSTTNTGSTTGSSTTVTDTNPYSGGGTGSTTTSGTGSSTSSTTTSSNTSSGNTSLLGFLSSYTGTSSSGSVTNPFTGTTATSNTNTGSGTTSTATTNTASTNTTTTTVTDPLLSIACPFNAGQTELKTQVTDALIGNRTEVLVQPRFSVPGMSGETLEFFALVEIRSLNKWYMAVQDAFHGDGIFIELIPGMPIMSFGTGTLTDGTTWICNVFAENFSDLDIAVQSLKAYNVHYYAGFAPVGDIAKGIYNDLRFVDIYF